MTDPGRRRLSRALNAEPPQSLIDAVSDEDLGHLGQAIDDVRGRQRDALNRAADQALSVLPRVLRGPVRKIAGG